MPVLSELATMTEVAQGTSLARFGDGELLIMANKDARHQRRDSGLVLALMDILNDSPCLVGAPHTRGLRSGYWREFLSQYGYFIDEEKWYGSSFVSRHDEVPWTNEHRELLRSLRLRPAPVIVAPPSYPTAQIFDHVVCAPENAYDDIDELEDTITRQQHPHPAILCCGPTATVLADRLARKGIWAVDLGNFGKFL